MDVLLQMYPSHRKEGDIYFILGTYLEQVYKEGMVKEKELLSATSFSMLFLKFADLSQNRVYLGGRGGR